MIGIKIYRSIMNQVMGIELCIFQNNSQSQMLSAQIKTDDRKLLLGYWGKLDAEQIVINLYSFPCAS